MHSADSTHGIWTVKLGFLKNRDIWVNFKVVEVIWALITVTMPCTNWCKLVSICGPIVRGAGHQELIDFIGKRCYNGEVSDSAHQSILKIVGTNGWAGRQQ